MDFTVRIDNTKGIVIVPVTGPCDRCGMVRMANEARAAAQSAGLPILYDMRAATPGDLARSDIFWLAQSMHVPRGGQAGRVRMATVYPPGFRALARFWEDSYNNVGIDARVFESGDEAIAWLRSAES
ncbi:MAG TPA: hypothetical protein VFJ62_17770 [Usitatibacter sp.]|nr:hypothetical protein [Usitatibacter sp.]